MQQEVSHFLLANQAMLEVKPNAIVSGSSGMMDERRDMVAHDAHANRFAGTQFLEGFAGSQFKNLS